MLPTYGSMDEALKAFDAYARIEPRLKLLWDLCRYAAPPTRETPNIGDAFDVDPFEVDDFAADKPDDGWCAEDYFREHVKSRLLLLAGLHRPGEPHELHSSQAYDALYDLLINWALVCPCSSCAADDDEDDDPLPREPNGSLAYR